MAHHKRIIITLAAATTEDHPLATPDVIDAYLAAMAAEGALP